MPVYLDRMTISQVSGNSAYGFYGHYRDTMVTIVKRQTVFANVNGLYRDTVTGLHGFGQCDSRMIIVEAVFPDSLLEEPFKLVTIIAIPGAYKPARTGVGFI